MKNFFKRKNSGQTLSEEFIEKTQTIEKQEKKKKNLSIDSIVLLFGRNLTFYSASIVSAFINLVFIANLTVTPIFLGKKLGVPAAVFYGILSSILDMAKIVSVTETNTLSELYRKLQKFPWAISLKKRMLRNRKLYIAFVCLSLITSVSLSTTSISGAISLNQNQQNYIVKLEDDFNDLNNQINSLNSDNKSLNSDKRGSSSKIDEAQKEYDALYKRYSDLAKVYGPALNGRDNEDNPVEASQDYKDLRVDWIGFRNKYNIALGDGVTNLSKNIKLRDYINAESDSYISENKDELVKIESDILNKVQVINANGNLRLPNGSQFKLPETTDISILLNNLDSLLQNYKNDDGDIGRSSKIFIIVAEKLNKNGRLKISVEILMSIMLFLLSSLVELVIYMNSPKVKISRRMLGIYSELLPAPKELEKLAEFDIDKFMKINDEELIKFDMLDLNRSEELKNVKKTLEPKPKKQQDSKQLKELENLREQVAVLQRENDKLKENSEKKQNEEPQRKIIQPKEDTSELIAALSELKNSLTGDK